MQKRRGFTLIEILIVIGIIAILAAIVIIAINPAKQFAQARNTQRESNVNAILNAIGQRMADNKGIFQGEFGAGEYECPELPTATSTIYADETVGAGIAGLGCLVPTYLPAFPVDPVLAEENNTGYTVRMDQVGRVSVCAPGAEEDALPDSSVICVKR